MLHIGTLYSGKFDCKLMKKSALWVAHELYAKAGLAHVGNQHSKSVGEDSSTDVAHTQGSK